MNLKTAKPAAEGQREVMASVLNARGEPYQYNDLTFPPGEWVAVEERLAGRIALLGWAKVRGVQ
jgi:hypothetical protein